MDSLTYLCTPRFSSHFCFRLKHIVHAKQLLYRPLTGSLCVFVITNVDEEVVLPFLDFVSTESIHFHG